MGQILNKSTLTVTHTHSYTLIKNTSVTTTLSLNEPLSPHIPPSCHNTPVARTVDPSGPVAIRALCEWRNGPNPGPDKLLSWQNLYVSVVACDITSPPRLCGIWGRLRFIVHPEPGHPRARVPIILPCHGYCSAGLDALRWHSRSVRSCGRNILPLIQEKTTLELVKHGPVSSLRAVLLCHCYVIQD